MNESQLLPDKILLEYVEKYTQIGHDCLRAAKRQNLPIYVIDTKVLKKRAQQFKQAFFGTLPNVVFYYAMKSNNSPYIADLLLGQGFGLDVSSGRELETALDLGARKVVFSGPGKTREELLLAVQNSKAVTILIDSFGELERLQEIARSEDVRVRCGVRLRSSEKWGKFGIGPEKLTVFWQRADECSHIGLRGIQFHTSWNLTPDVQVDFITLLSNELHSLPSEFRKQVEFVDVGGGYWPPGGEWLQAYGTTTGKISILRGEAPGSPLAHYINPSMPLEKYADKISQGIQSHILPVADCTICFEPGRWICNDSMHLLLTVVDVKDEHIVITDAGTNAVGWERFETDYCPVINLTRPSLKENACNIYGSLCTPHDIWGYSYFGEDIKEGDVLMIPCQGAYTYSLRQEFIKPLPSVFVI